MAANTGRLPRRGGADYAMRIVIACEQAERDLVAVWDEACDREVELPELAPVLFELQRELVKMRQKASAAFLKRTGRGSLRRAASGPS